MSLSCKKSCTGCSDTHCPSAQKAQTITAEKKNEPKRAARTVIAVMSGKGGVGKSFVTSRLALELTRQGKRVGILDADVTGPSIPYVFGLTDRLKGLDGRILPARTKTGIQVVSSNLMLEDPHQAIAWRGPVITGALKQFYFESAWEDLDVLLIDLPPGTSDVLLTLMQSFKLDGLISVSSPQDLVSHIVRKALSLTSTYQVPLLGLVENMSYLTCSHCGEKQEIFGPSHLPELLRDFPQAHGARLALNPAFAAAVDAGTFEECLFDDELDELVCELITLSEKSSGNHLDL